MYRGQVYQNHAKIIDVEFISDERAALKAISGGGLFRVVTSRAHGERVARELARES